ncbi:MAG: TRAP transporter substrate-binding protein DctP [Spirochaeta sp.]|jgi:TRAP-type C4-dicarboxylate transport system substrate-binding protein|nr:TRAP transporter substrate-binding protein DctP [Spirochaeta sp.]
MRAQRSIMAIVILVVAAGLVFAAGQGEQTWKVGHVRPQGTSTDVDLTAFADAVAENSDGTITIDVFPASQLGNYTVVQERVGIGDVEMQLAPASNGVTKALGITSAPYLVTDWEDAQQTFAWGGDLMNAVEELFAGENIKVLAQYPKYFGGIALAEEPADPTNPYADQGLKIRVPGIKSFELTATALGYLATPIPFSEAFTAMQTGIVEGVIGSGAEGYWSSFRDLTNYYLPVNSHFEMWFLYMNMSEWEGLSAEQQEIVMDSARAMETARWEAAPDETESYEEQLAGIGAEIIPFTDADLAEIADKVREEVWPQIEDEYGAELFRRITN